MAISTTGANLLKMTSSTSLLEAVNSGNLAAFEVARSLVECLSLLHSRRIYLGSDISPSNVHLGQSKGSLQTVFKTQKINPLPEEDLFRRNED